MLRAVAQNEAGTASGAEGPSVATGACPHTVAHPLMDQDWIALSFLHWPYDPAAVQRLLPPRVTVDTFDGAAWVSLVPFLLRVRIPRGPALPWLGVFPETNVRTYVVGPDGQRGIWFFSLEAPRVLAIWAARLGYHLPYQVAALDMRCDARTRRYASWRLHGPQRSASCRATITVGPRLDDTDITPLEHFLTARWRLYTATRGGGLATARVEHQPWELYRADADDVDAHVVSAAGLPRPGGDPLVHACGDVHASLTRLVPC
jgi:uncharacterized protein